MDIEKALINDGLRVSKLYSEFCIPKTFYNRETSVCCALNTWDLLKGIRK